jgi:uncharacterized membrane protein YtjA (UPF0391 family)
LTTRPKRQRKNIRNAGRANLFAVISPLFDSYWRASWLALGVAISQHGTNRGGVRSSVDGWRRLRFQESGMIYWGLVFIIIAVMATAFGLGGIAAASAGVAQLLAMLLTVLFAISILAGFYRRAR